MTSADFLDACVTVTLILLSLSFLMIVCRIVLGPTLPDRIMGLDTLVVIAIGFLAVIGLETSYYSYLDIAIALGLVGFLSTTAFARYVFLRGRGRTEEARARARTHAVPVTDETAGGGSGQ